MPWVNMVLFLHDRCSTHKQAMACWNDYTANIKRHTSVAHRLETAREQVTKANRHYIKTLAEILLLCAKQELAVRGHRELTGSKNQGNFLEVLKLVADHDAVIKERIHNNPHNATYTSPEIQNQLLEVMGGIVRERICEAIQDATYFSLLVDETKDVSKVEQLAIVLRYIDIKAAAIHERFLTYVPAESLTAESLTTYILTTLRKYQLDYKFMVSQGYDGASVMSGGCSGVQTRICEIAPQAIYVHCNAHCLNLCLVDCAKAVREASEFFLLHLKPRMCSYLHLNATQYSCNSRKKFILTSNHDSCKGSQILGGPAIKVLSILCVTHLML